MDAYLDLEELHIPILMKRSDRKTLSLSITDREELLIKAPLHMPEYSILKFINQKQFWIYKTIKRNRQEKKYQISRTREEESALRKQARKVLYEKTDAYAKQIGVSFSRIRIGNQKTLWGSCSTSGTISYNWKLILMPETIQDYVVVHELCHRLEMNHSKAFWDLVTRILPDARSRAHWLKVHGKEFQ